ncbi:MAG: class I SAM-dependent methyltransferase [Rhodospirillales bacterium]|nr:class I SAM-dependent methyltransferase [Rhodospirillales bacterium]
MTDEIQLDTNAPMFDGIYGVFGNPVRQLFMMGTLWELARRRPERQLRILEIGSWVGFSALTWAWAVAYYAGARGSVLCIDSWAPYFDTTVNQSNFYIGTNHTLNNGDAYQLFLHNTGFAPDDVKIEHRRAASQEVLPTLPDASFDIVYIDGDHSFDSVLGDLKAAERLVSEGGIICGDDLEVQAHECTLSITQLDRNLDTAQDIEADIVFHPGVTLAVAEILGVVSAWHGYWAMRRKNGGWQPLSLEGMPTKMPPHIPDWMIPKDYPDLFG